MTYLRNTPETRRRVEEALLPILTTTQIPRVVEVRGDPATGMMTITFDRPLPTRHRIESCIHEALASD